MNTISPVYARIVLRELERRHIPTESMFSRTELSREQLLHEGDIALEDFLEILRTGHALSGDDQLGLMIGSQSQVFTLGEVGAAMAIAPTIRQGLQVAESFTRLHTSYTILSATSNLDGLTLQMRFQEDLGDTLRFHVESAAILIQNYIETITARRLNNARFKLAIEEPKYVQSYAQYLHSPVEFGAEVSLIQLPMDCLDLPSPYYNANMWQLAQAQLSLLLKAINTHSAQPYTTFVRGLFNSSAPPLPDLAAVANTLCMSPRTLNRRLRDEGNNFRQLKTQVLLTQAKQYLTQTDKSVEVIAGDLGYQDTANFRRAFRKGMGCSAGAFRKRTIP